jgi:hypothetical protein
MGSEGQYVTVERQCRVEIGHGDADMCDPGAIGHAVTPANGDRSGSNL